MYTEYTYQDWLAAADKGKTAKTVVDNYRASNEFRQALDADRYFAGDNPSLDDKYIVKIDTRTEKDENGIIRKHAAPVNVEGNRISSNFLRRFVVQQNQFLLGNGVTLDNAALKNRLGLGFDNAIQRMGERALLHGVSYGYWNLDHLEVLPAAVDSLTGCVALLDERTSALGCVIQFWQLSAKRPRYMRVFEPDGVTLYKIADGRIAIEEEKRAYKLKVRRDALGERIEGTENWGALPVIPLYGNDERRSELTESIRTKIDAYDNILSDYGDNLDRANEVYWVLNNFGGDTVQAMQVIEEISRIRVAMTMSDGSGTSSAEPRTIEVPYAARQTALDILRRELYADYMALNMDELTGGSLTNVAIQTAMTNINLKCDRYEWQCFRFVQSVLALLGIKTENIKFKRMSFVNRTEIIQDITMMRQDIDQETALKLNPYIDEEDIPGIIDAVDQELQTGGAKLDLTDETDSMEA